MWFMPNQIIAGWWKAFWVLQETTVEVHATQVQMLGELSITD